MATVEEDPDLAAAELALGLLEGEEQAAALRRLASDPGFAVAVEQWRDRFAALFAAWPAVTPPAAIAARIEASLDGRAGGQSANDNHVAHGGPSLKGSEHRWRSLAVAASLAACLLLAVTTTLMLRPAPEPVRIPVAVAGPAPLIAALAPTGTAPGVSAPVAAAYDAHSGAIRLAAVPTVATGRVAELWAIRGSAAPRSLGLLPASGPGRVAVPMALRAMLAADTVIAISIEPAGGSPTGLPTGPVVAAGKLSA